MCFFDFGFWQDLVSNSLATVLGIVLGIPVAFWIDRLFSKKEDEKERIKLEQIEIEKRKELLHLHRKVNLQLEITYSTFQAMQNYGKIRTNLVQAILAHIPRVKSEISNALKMISVELGKTTKGCCFELAVLESPDWLEVWQER